MRVYFFQFILLSFLLVFTSPISATDFDLSSLEHIVIDVRDSRGGNGDVAAGYLTSLDLIERHKFKGPISFVMEEIEVKILSQLLDLDITDGFSHKINGTTVNFFLPESISKAKLPPADIVLQMARGQGGTHHHHEFEFVPNGEHANSGIAVKKDTGMVMTYTVYGNTENLGAERPYSTVLRNGDEFFSTSSAGIGANESGIYYDPIANHLKGKSEDEIAEYIVEQAKKMNNQKMGAYLTSLMQKEALQGSRSALVYGIHVGEQKDQFIEYLEGAIRNVNNGGDPINFITPSNFTIDDLPSHLKGKIEFIDPTNPPKKALAGKVYLSRVGALPHEVFTALLGYSQVPPIIAGDGALSAALVFKKPFVMTSVEWNKKNIENLGELLLHAAPNDPKMQETILRIFPSSGFSPDLNYAMDLQESAFSEVFSDATKKISPISDSILNTYFTLSNTNLESIRPKNVSDAILRRHLIVEEMKRVGINSASNVEGFNQTLNMIIDDIANDIDVDIFAEQLITQTDEGLKKLGSHIAFLVETADVALLNKMNTFYMSLDTKEQKKVNLLLNDTLLNSFKETPADSLNTLLFSIKDIIKNLDNETINKIDEILKARDLSTSISLIELIRNPDSNLSKSFVTFYLNGSEIYPSGQGVKNLTFNNFLIAIEESNFDQTRFATEASYALRKNYNITKLYPQIAAERIEEILKFTDGFNKEAMDTFFYNKETREVVSKVISSGIYLKDVNSHRVILQKIIEGGFLNDLDLDLQVKVLSEGLKKGTFNAVIEGKSPILKSPAFLEVIDGIEVNEATKANSVLLLLSKSPELRENIQSRVRVANAIFDLVHKYVVPPLKHHVAFLKKFPVDSLAASKQIKYLEIFFRTMDDPLSAHYLEDNYSEASYWKNLLPETLGSLESMLLENPSPLLSQRSQDAALNIFIRAEGVDPDSVDKAIEKSTSIYSKEYFHNIYKQEITNKLHLYFKRYNLCF